MKKHLLLVALSLASSAALAQASFRPGYIVALSGDTVRGGVQYQGGQSNGLRCRFQPTASEAVAEYQPGQIQGYGFSSGLRYQSRQLPGATAAPAFLQALVLGKASLYRFINEHDKDLYYVGTSPAAPVAALIQQDTLMTSPNATKEVYGKALVRTYPFRNVLWKVMADCPSVQTTLARLELKESALVKVFSAYNACVDGKTEAYVAKKQVATLHMAVLGGLNQSSMTYLDKGADGLKSAKGFTGGLGLEVLPTRFNPHFSVQLQALYMQHSSSMQYKNLGDGVYPNENIRRQVSIDLKAIRVPLMLRYMMLTKGIRPYVQVGGQGAVMLQNEVLDVVSGGSANSGSTTVRTFTRLNVGWIGGAGVSVAAGPGSLQLEARVDRMANVMEVLSNYRGFSLLAGYTFGRW